MTEIKKTTQRKRAAEPNGRPRFKVRGLRASAWWILRNRKEATIEGLLNTLNDGTAKDAFSNLGKYLRALERAGIIKRSAQRVPGNSLTSNGHIRYVLVIDCGIDAPLWRASKKEVYAPSTGVIYPIGDSHE